MYSVQITMTIFINFVKNKKNKTLISEKRGCTQDENAVENIY